MYEERLKERLGTGVPPFFASPFSLSQFSRNLVAIQSQLNASLIQAALLKSHLIDRGLFFQYHTIKKFRVGLLHVAKY